MAPQRIIIDTDPGVDDILAMLLAFSATAEEVEVVLVSVTYGNVEVHDCLRNVASLFHIIGKEQEWRRSQSRPDGFDTLKTIRPIVAVGAEEPLADQIMMADFYHGKDGLGNIHSTVHPHLSASDTWKTLFTNDHTPPEVSKDLDSTEVEHSTEEHLFFTPSKLPAPKEILKILKENEKDTITIVAIGPLTNLAIAAAEDPETFLRAKEVVVMGGAIDVPGNVTPLAEFNFCADAFAAARILALTSPNPSTTMPPTPPSPSDSTPTGPPPPFLAPYPKQLSRQLNLTLLPLDITTSHLLTPSTFHRHSDAPLKASSPLAEWTSAFLAPTFGKINDSLGALSLHDPLAIWYAIKHLTSSSDSPDPWVVAHDKDIRVEAAGQWTRGFCVTDKRPKAKEKRSEDPDIEVDVSGDAGGWLSEKRGNRVSVLTGTPVMEGRFGEVLCERIFGVDDGSLERVVSS